MKDIIKKETVFNHDIDKVWNAISKAEEISTWFIKADFKAEKGYKYTFTASEDKGCITINGEVKAANPYTLTYTWVAQNTNVETTVTWVLETVKEGTKLYLEHSGISNYEGETAIKMFESFNGGWDGCINLLTDYLKETVHAG
ncbi:SRPBCC family protein [Mariniflexile sp.]|uniref:SRPBCC family protein n=1 Tax=Mariniflexile sp. TaxID=1979402 RepID=UPI004048C583